MWLVTGAAGFIGSHFYDLLKAEDEKVLVVDALTYASDSRRVDRGDLHVGDITNKVLMRHIVETNPIEVVVNFAAESHVDNSYRQVPSFTRSNVDGVVVLLEAVRDFCPESLFIQISTDEVYGDEPISHPVSSALNPQNPYAATKAAAEFMVNGYARAFGLRTMIVRSSNNWGPRQHEEKFLPSVLRAKKAGTEFTLYGSGLSRDFIHVEDNVRAIRDLVGAAGSGTWNIATGKQTMLEEVLDRVAPLKWRLSPERPGVDVGYWVDPEATWRTLGWEPRPFGDDERWDLYASEAI